MKRVLVGLIVLMLEASVAGATTVSGISSHPRFLFHSSNPADYPYQNQFWFNNSATDKGWGFKIQAFWNRTAQTSFDVVDDCAAYGLVTGNATYKANAIKLGRRMLALNFGSLLEAGTTPGRDDPFVMLYDWLYSDLAAYPTFKDSLEAHMLAIININKALVDTPSNGTYVWYKYHVFPPAYVAYGEMNTAADRDTVAAVLQRFLNRYENDIEPCWTQTGLYTTGPSYYFGVYSSGLINLLDCLKYGIPSHEYLFTDNLTEIQDWADYWRHSLRPQYSPRRGVGRYNTNSWNDNLMLGFVARDLGDPYCQYLLEQWRLNYFNDNTWSDYGAGESMSMALFYNPNRPATDPTNLCLAYSPAAKIGRYYWRDSWSMSKTSTASILAYYCGWDFNEDQERGQGHFTLTRGGDDLLITAGKFRNSNDQHYQNYCARTISHNSFLVYDATETLIPDGGQVASNRTTGGSGCPACNGKVGKRGTGDTLAVGPTRLWGADGIFTEDYSAGKVSYARRKVQVPLAGWVIVQDSINVVGPKDLRIIWHCIDKPLTDGKPTIIQGDANYGGIWKSLLSTYMKVTRGTSRAYVYPCYPANLGWETRRVGGQSSNGGVWKQNVSSGQALTWVPTAAEQAYECWITAEQKNRTETGSMNQAWIDGRNTEPHACGDWRFEWMLPNANGGVHLCTLIQYGSTTALTNPLTVSTTEGTSAWDLSVYDATPPLLFHVPYFNAALVSTVTIAIPYDNVSCYINGLVNGSYYLCRDGVQFGTATASANGLTFTSTTPGTYVVSSTGCFGGATTGACCAPSGACTVTTLANCSSPSTWIINEVCSPNPCPQPLGACCAVGGSCTYVTQAACAGTWQGYGTVCSPNPCPLPVGSCCHSNGSCDITTQGDCADTWTESGVCVPNTCDQPRGACCASSGACTYVTQESCADSWLGMDTVCDPNPCPFPVGSCCYADGSCVIMVESVCTGTWTLAGSCIPNECDQPTGACCDFDGVCTVTTQASCDYNWSGYGTTCTPNDCPQPPPYGPGACCLDDGSCLYVIEADCPERWLGTSAVCSPTPCWQPPSLLNRGTGRRNGTSGTGGSDIRR